MAVTDTPFSETFDGNGSTLTPYPISFSYSDAADVKMTVGGEAYTTFTVASDGVRTQSEVPAGTAVVIYRDTPMDQETEFPPNTTPSAPAVGAGLDKLTRIAQEQRASYDKALTDPDGGFNVPTDTDVYWYRNAQGNLVPRTKAQVAADVTAEQGSPTGVKVTATTADAASRALLEPEFTGQVMVQLDDNSQWVGQSLTAGNWVPGSLTEADGDIRYTMKDERAPLTPLESAGLLPFSLPPVSPYPDPDAEDFIAANSITDERAIVHVHRLTALLKGLGIWANVDNAFLFGTAYQSSHTTLKSLTAANTSAGTSTPSTYGSTFNGTTDKYLVTNNGGGTALTAKSYMALFKSAGTQQVNALISSYEGGSARGPQLAVGGNAIGHSVGPSTVDNVGWLVTESDGSTTQTLIADTASDEQWCFAAGCYDGTRATLYTNDRDPITATHPELWSNNANYGIGANSNSSHFLDGQLLFVAIVDAAIDPGTMFALRKGLESIFDDVITTPPAVVWEGNSLTASAPGGGSTWPAKLMAKTGWSDIERSVNLADDGARQTQRIETRYFYRGRNWLPTGTQDVVYFLWSGVNDITASIATADIIASLRRHTIRAKADGFRVILLTLTPVADSGTGLSYGYSAAQQTSLTDINTWIRGEGALLADQVVDLDEIGTTYPEFLDPTDTTYYVSGDGLHHNDAGRALIADKVNAEVSYPV